MISPDLARADCSGRVHGRIEFERIAKAASTAEVAICEFTPGCEYRTYYLTIVRRGHASHRRAAKTQSSKVVAVVENVDASGAAFLLRADTDENCHPLNDLAKPLHAKLSCIFSAGNWMHSASKPSQLAAGEELLELV